MKKLLSLPPNLVNSFHEITGLNKDEWFCTTDPIGVKLGSGGGTTWLLQAAYSDEKTGQKTDACCYMRVDRVVVCLRMVLLERF